MGYLNILPEAVPKSLKGLVIFLEHYPLVRITGWEGDVEECVFARVHRIGIWFTRPTGSERFLPILCRIGPAGASEGGLEFDDAGFTFEKFGKAIRVEYLGRRIG
jgi:hypothetical protein